jgi:hypothetical protein
MNPVRYRYREEVLAHLWTHGLQPTAATPPQLAYDFVSDLYRYELRRLRDRLLRGDIDKNGYADRVIAIRRRYPLLSFAARSWAAEELIPT